MASWPDPRACLCALFTDSLLMRQDGEAVVQPIVQFLPEVAGVTLLFRSFENDLIVQYASCDGRYARALRRTFRH
jgi:hypothetical protein